MRRFLGSGILVVLLLVGCGGDDDVGASTPDSAIADAAGDGANPMDASGDEDAESPDSGPADLGIEDAALDDASLDASEERDASTPADSGPVDAGADVVGVITGTCGELDDAELLSGSPFYFRNAIDFPMGFTTMDEMNLSAGAMEILAEGTAGGSSGLSEAFSFEVLHRCEGASLVKTETEIVYDPIGSNKTDILVEIDGHRVGVSVTRAVAFPFDMPFPVDRAQMLLERKLLSIQESTMNVVAEDAWVKQILHVIAYAPMHADSIQAAWDLIDPSIRGDTILYVTVTDGDDAFIY